MAAVEDHDNKKGALVSLHSRGQHMIFIEDINSLFPNEWLTSSAINFYMDLICNQYPRVAFLNTDSFWLMYHSAEESEEWAITCDCTSSIDFTKNDKIFVPVNTNNHWVLIEIDLKIHQISFYNSLNGSMKESEIRKILGLFNEFLMCNGFIDNKYAEVVKDTPQQTNANDCGVFVIKIVLCRVLDTALNFSQKDIPSLRNQFATELIENKLRIQVI